MSRVSVLDRRLADAKLRHAGAERARIHVQQERSALGPADAPSGGLESFMDRGTLRLLESRDAARRAWVDVRERLGKLHDRSPGEDTSTLQDILQFSNVAWPRIGYESVHVLLPYAFEGL